MVISRATEGLAPYPNFGLPGEEGPSLTALLFALAVSRGVMEEVIDEGLAGLVGPVPAELTWLRECGNPPDLVCVVGEFAKSGFGHVLWLFARPGERY